MSKIQKIFFCSDGTNVLGIVVKREDGIERYEFTNEVWSKLVTEMIKTYPDDTKGESNKERIVSILQDKGRIIASNDNLITNIEIFGYGLAKKIIVNYASGKTEELLRHDMENEDEFNKTWNMYKEKFCEIYGYDIATIEDSKMAKKELTIDKEVKNLKKGLKKSLLALATATCILAGSVVSGNFVAKFVTDASTKGQGKEETEAASEMPSITPRPTETITPTATPTNTPTPTETPTEKPTEEPTQEPTEEPTPIIKPTPTIEFQVINPSVTPVPVVGEEVNPTMAPWEKRLASGYPYEMEYVNPEDASLLLTAMTPSVNEPLTVEEVKRKYGSDYLNFDNLVEVSNMQISMLANYLNHDSSLPVDVYGEDPLPDEVDLIYFEQFFTKDVVDRVCIQYFSDLLNEVKYQAYRNNDNEKAIAANGKALYELLRFFYNRQPLQQTIDGKEKLIYITDMSPTAQNALFQFAEAFYFMQGKNEVIYDGDSYSQDDLASILFGYTPEESPVK